MANTLQSVRTPQVNEMEETLNQMKDRAAELEKQTRGFIIKNPTTAVVGAVVVGFLIGRLVNR